MAATIINSLAEMSRFTGALASALGSAGSPPLLLTGPLGCGKTTMTSLLCHALPGGEIAEISSPSFTICNLYPCQPQVLHCDFYRIGGDVPEDVWNFLEETQGQLIVEWPELIKTMLNDFLDISFNVINHARKLDICGSGNRGRAALAALSSAWPLK